MQRIRKQRYLLKVGNVPCTLPVVNDLPTVAKILGISKQAVQGIERHAMWKIRTALQKEYDELKSSNTKRK